MTRGFSQRRTDLVSELLLEYMSLHSDELVEWGEITEVLLERAYAVTEIRTG